ncbi:MAG TPA: YIP1 family protein [Gammaproteobacteria bacterium]|nr:YIP1 family protein [Gammaproteobacteria bacterium]
MATGFIQRMVRAARLDPALYEEVEADRGATAQAAAVVVLASIAAGIGGIYYAGGAGFIFTAIAALIGWVIWAGLVYLIGAKLLPEPQTRADMGQLLRTIGFSSSPGLIRVLGIIPGIGFIFMAIGNIWMLIAMVIGVRQALDYNSTWRAVGVCFLGWIVQLVVMFLLGGLVGGAAPVAPQTA